MFSSPPSIICNNNNNNNNNNSASLFIQKTAFVAEHENFLHSIAPINLIEPTNSASLLNVQQSSFVNSAFIYNNEKPELVNNGEGYSSLSMESIKNDTNPEEFAISANIFSADNAQIRQSQLQTEQNLNDYTNGYLAYSFNRNIDPMVAYSEEKPMVPSLYSTNTLFIGTPEFYLHSNFDTSSKAFSNNNILDVKADLLTTTCERLNNENLKDNNSDTDYKHFIFNYDKPSISQNLTSENNYILDRDSNPVFQQGPLNPVNNEVQPLPTTSANVHQKKIKNNRKRPSKSQKLIQKFAVAVSKEPIQTITTTPNTEFNQITAICTTELREQKQNQLLKEFYLDNGEAQNCAVCVMPIHDPFLLCVDQKFYHSACLKCNHCNVVMDHSLICFSKLDSLYCKECYVKKFQNKCASCEREIQSSDWVRKAHAFLYHLACFSCHHCKRQLSTGEQFSLQNNHLLCKQHYLELVQGDDVSIKKAKRVRTTFAEEQLGILQTHFQIDCNPDGADLERIANLTGLSKRVTQVWFQNSRARQKKYSVGGLKKCDLGGGNFANGSSVGGGSFGGNDSSQTMSNSLSGRTSAATSTSLGDTSSLLVVSPGRTPLDHDGSAPDAEIDNLFNNSQDCQRN